MERKRSEQRKCQKKDINLINNNDNQIAPLIAVFRVTAEKDADLYEDKKLVMRKIAMNPSKMTV